MKGFIKAIIIIAVLCLVFGAASVKGWLGKGVDIIDKGATSVKNSEQVQGLKKDIVSGFKDLLPK